MLVGKHTDFNLHSIYERTNFLRDASLPQSVLSLVIERETKPPYRLIEFDCFYVHHVSECVGRA